jgi:DNA-directed RNA polymerase subunit M
MMIFCPKCGSILVQKTKNFGCPRCGYASKEKMKLEVREKLDEGQKIDVIKDKDVDILPRVPAICKKCGHTEAHFWTSQTRAADEAETKFFRCTKCRHTWREYK